MFTRKMTIVIVYKVWNNIQLCSLYAKEHNGISK